MCGSDEYIIKDRVIDSSRAVNSNYNEPIVELKSPINDVVGACIMSANIPFTYYTIDSTNNTFVLQSTTVTIPAQTCNANNFTYVLANAVTAASVSGAANFGFIVDNTTTQLIIYNTAGTSFTIDFTASTAASEALGFAAASYTSTLHSTLISGGTTVYGNDDVALNSSYHVLVSPFAANLTGPGQIYVHDKILGPAMNGAITNESNYGDIVGEVRVNTNYQGIITYDNIAPAMYECQTPSIKKLQLYLTLGSRTTSLDLQGQKFQVKIRFFCRKRAQDKYGVDANGNGNVASVGTGASFMLRNGKRPKFM